nr:lipid A deacylase LpxR family protein [Acetobacter conturbans]
MRRPAMLLLGTVFGISAISQAHATPLQDHQGTWTLQGENDAVSTLNGTSDQYYTSGLRFNWTSGTDELPAPIATINRAILGKGMQRISLGLQQMIFTPSNTQAATPSPRDRPYAGVLLGTINLINDTDLSRSVFGIQLGVMGPDALARQLQNGFHGAIGDTSNKGWQHQLANQPIFQVQMGRTWRLPLGTIGGANGLSFDMLPTAAARIGDYRIAGTIGDTIRFGQGLDSDFGVPTIGSGTDGTDAYKETRTVPWYFFGGVTGDAVAYDATLEGNTLRSNSPHVNKKWDVGEIHAGLAVMFYGVRLSYSQVWQTQEFTAARSGLFNYGSVALSAKF